MQTRTIGALAGLLFGAAVLQWGFWRALLTLGGFALLGWLAGCLVEFGRRVLAGEASLDALVDRLARRDVR